MAHLEPYEYRPSVGKRLLTRLSSLSLHGDKHKKKLERRCSLGRLEPWPPADDYMLQLGHETVSGVPEHPSDVTNDTSYGGQTETTLPKIHYTVTNPDIVAPLPQDEEREPSSSPYRSRSMYLQQGPHHIGSCSLSLRKEVPDSGLQTLASLETQSIQETTICTNSGPTTGPGLLGSQIFVPKTSRSRRPVSSYSPESSTTPYPYSPSSYSPNPTYLEGVPCSRSRVLLLPTISEKTGPPPIPIKPRRLSHPPDHNVAVDAHLPGNYLAHGPGRTSQSQHVRRGRITPGAYKPAHPRQPTAVASQPSYTGIAIQEPLIPVLEVESTHDKDGGDHTSQSAGPSRVPARPFNARGASQSSLKSKKLLSPPAVDGKEVIWQYLRDTASHLWNATLDTPWTDEVRDYGDNCQDGSKSNQSAERLSSSIQDAGKHPWVANLSSSSGWSDRVAESSHRSGETVPIISTPSKHDSGIVVGPATPVATAKHSMICAVCAEDLPLSSFSPWALTLACQHECHTCRSCIQQWIQTQLTERQWDQLHCIECAELLAYEDVTRHADAATVARYDQLATRAALSQDENFRWCLRPGCESGQIHEGGEEAPLFACRACGHQYCILHQEPHQGETCGQFDDRLNGVTASAGVESDVHSSSVPAQFDSDIALVQSYKVREAQEAADLAHAIALQEESVIYGGGSLRSEWVGLRDQSVPDLEAIRLNKERMIQEDADLAQAAALQARFEYEEEDRRKTSWAYSERASRRKRESEARVANDERIAREIQASFEDEAASEQRRAAAATAAREKRQAELQEEQARQQRSREAEAKRQRAADAAEAKRLADLQKEHARQQKLLEAEANRKRGAETAEAKRRADLQKEQIRRKKLREAVAAGEALVKQVSKPCPGCKAPIQKNDGCSHMTCTRCRYEFCWACLASHKDILRGGNTFHRKSCGFYA